MDCGKISDSFGGGTDTTLSQTERLSGMASLAVIKVGFAEGALPVVTGHATLGAGVWEMLCGKGRGDLAALWKAARADVVAAIAVEILPRAMSGVAEPEAERAGGGRGRSVASCPVTSAA